MRTRIAITTSLLSLALAAGLAAQTIQPPAWLAGCWEQRAGNRESLEMWMVPAGGMMLGSSRTIAGGAVREYEQVMLTVEGGKLLYTASPSGQATASFTSTDVTDSSFTVENRRHDFPQRIIYRRRGADSLVARIEGPGPSGTGTRGLDYPMRRTTCTAAPAVGQSPTAPAAYPVRPTALPDAEEILLARSAAPADISAAASVYTIRDGKPFVLRAGTNGCACMVSRDLHAGSLYPICFDVEGTKSVMLRELMELGLRMQGRSEEQVVQAVDSAYRTGALRPPGTFAMAYMMSSRQVLFTSPLADGQKVGAWHPHVMLFIPDATPEQLGLVPDSRVSAISISAPGTKRAEIVIPVPAWADR